MTLENEKYNKEKKLYKKRSMHNSCHLIKISYRSTTLTDKATKGKCNHGCQNVYR